MLHNRARRAALIGAALLGLVTSSGATRIAGSTAVIYAWDRPERLAAGVPASTPIAYYAATVSLRAGDVVWRPRAHPLFTAPKTPRIAVIHIEPAPRVDRRALDAALTRYLVEQIVAVAQVPDVVEIQLDYEARVSERPFATALLTELRAALPRSLPLSMTALASWCLFDTWVAALPVDDIVPMVYRMGADRQPIRERLARGEPWRVPACRRSIAVSLADPPPRIPTAQRIFYFNPRSWTDIAVARALQEGQP